MSRISAEFRARMCSFTYSDGRRCRLPRAATGEGYCPTHAAKFRKQRADECVAGLLTEPIAHQALSSTSLTFMLARLFALVANGHVPPKTSNALLRIVDGLRKTLPNTTREFLNCYDTRGLRNLVENLYNEQEEFLRLTESESPADAAKPLSATTLPLNTPANNDQPRPRPALSPDELLKRLEKRLATR